jgi:anti-sigma B factor antagonist
MSKLEITQRQNENVTILDLSGKIQLGESSIKFRTSLRQLTQEGKKHILLNLAETTQIDSCGLGELVASFVSVEKSGGEIKLLNLTKRVSELMMITKLLTVFEVYENEEQAVNSFQIISANGELKKSANATGKLDKA